MKSNIPIQPSSTPIKWSKVHRFCRRPCCRIVKTTAYQYQLEYTKHNPGHCHKNVGCSHGPYWFKYSMESWGIHEEYLGKALPHFLGKILYDILLHGRPDPKQKELPFMDEHEHEQLQKTKNNQV